MAIDGVSLRSRRLRWVSRACFIALDLAAQLGHPLADAAPVGLDLGLTGTTQTHPAAAAAGAATGLPRHRLTPAAQPRQHVLHLRQRHLRLALPAGGVLGEDVQDQRGAVDDLDLDRLLQRGQLRRGQFTVADDGVGAGRHDHLAEFGRLARADIGRRVGPVAALDEAFEHLRSRRSRPARPVRPCWPGCRRRCPRSTPPPAPRAPAAAGGIRPRRRRRVRWIARRRGAAPIGLRGQVRRRWVSPRSRGIREPVSGESGNVIGHFRWWHVAGSRCILNYSRALHHASAISPRATSTDGPRR